MFFLDLAHLFLQNFNAFGNIISLDRSELLEAKVIHELVQNRHIELEIFGVGLGSEVSISNLKSLLEAFHNSGLIFRGVIEQVSAAKDSQALVEFLQKLAAVRGSVASKTIEVFFSQAADSAEGGGDDSDVGDLEFGIGNIILIDFEDSGEQFISVFFELFAMVTFVGDTDEFQVELHLEFVVLSADLLDKFLQEVEGGVEINLDFTSEVSELIVIYLGNRSIVAFLLSSRGSLRSVDPSSQLDISEEQRRNGVDLSLGTTFKEFLLENFEHFMVEVRVIIDNEVDQSADQKLFILEFFRTAVFIISLILKKRVKESEDLVDEGDAIEGEGTVGNSLGDLGRDLSSLDEGQVLHQFRELVHLEDRDRKVVQRLGEELDDASQGVLIEFGGGLLLAKVARGSEDIVNVLDVIRVALEGELEEGGLKFKEFLEFKVGTLGLDDGVDVLLEHVEEVEAVGVDGDVVVGI